MDRKVLAIATGMLVWLLGLCLAAISQEGWIVWSSDRAGDGKLNLWVIAPDGDGARQLTVTFRKCYAIYRIGTEGLDATDQIIFNPLY